jgi:hypothetical protein
MKHNNVAGDVGCADENDRNVLGHVLTPINGDQSALVTVAAVRSAGCVTEHHHDSTFALFVSDVSELCFLSLKPGCGYHKSLLMMEIDLQRSARSF